METGRFLFSITLLVLSSFCRFRTFALQRQREHPSVRQNDESFQPITVDILEVSTTTTTAYKLGFRCFAKNSIVLSLPSFHPKQKRFFASFVSPNRENVLLLSSYTKTFFFLSSASPYMRTFFRFCRLPNTRTLFRFHHFAKHDLNVLSLPSFRHTRERFFFHICRCAIHENVL